MRFSAYLLIAAGSAFLLSIQGVNAAEQCEPGKGGAVETEKCLQQSTKQVQLIERKPTAFPAGLSGKTFDSASQQYKTMTWVSPDGKRLRYLTTLPCTLVCSGGDILLKEVSADRIISFTQGVAGEGSTVGDAIVGTAIAAAIVPILAPFQAMATTRSTITFAYTITYVGDDGDEITDNLLATSLVPVWDGFYTFLPTLTGLKYGEKKLLDQLRTFYESGAKKLESKIQADQSLLVEQDAKKPWCAKFKTSEYPLIYSRYKSNIASLNKLRVKLGVNEYKPLDNQGTEDLWNKYLTANPNFAIWVKANPSAAAKVKSCPAAAA